MGRNQWNKELQTWHSPFSGSVDLTNSHEEPNSHQHKRECERHHSCDQAHIDRVDRLHLMRIHTLNNLAGFALSHVKDRYPNEDEQRGNSPRNPSRLNFGEHRVESETHADRSQTRPHSARKRAFIGKNGAIFGEVCAVLAFRISGFGFFRHRLPMREECC